MHNKSLQSAISALIIGVIIELNKPIYIINQIKRPKKEDPNQFGLGKKNVMKDKPKLALFKSVPKSLI
jgi:hypothetical protein